MNSVFQAQEKLNTLKIEVVGIFKNNGVFELVLSYDEEFINSIIITQFGAIQQQFNIPRRFGILKLFPDDKNMKEMLDFPFAWDAFMKQFN